MRRPVWTRSTTISLMPSRFRAIMYQGTTASLCVGTNAKAFQASGHAHPVVAETRGRGRRIDLTAVRHEGSSVLSGFNRRRQSSCKADTTLVERWIIAALRHRRFLSIEELSQAIRGLRDRINQRPFRKREGSRVSVALDRPALSPLPAGPFDLSQWSRARVNIDYHMVFDAFTACLTTWWELLEVRSRSWAHGRHSRAPATFPPGASGVDSLPDGSALNLGDCYTFVAIERHSKLALNIAMGKRDQATTDALIEGIRHSTAHRGKFQITTDGYRPVVLRCRFPALRTNLVPVRVQKCPL